MKKRIVLFLTVIMALLTGCQSIDLTAKQEDLVAEYSAYSILQRSYSYSNILVDPAALEQETEKTEIESQESQSQESESVTNDDSGTTTQTDNGIQLNLMLGLENFEVSYNGYEVLDSYPGSANTSYILKAVDGAKLLIVKFGVSNKTSQPIIMDMHSKQISYSILINGNKKYDAKLTVIPDALNTYNDTVEINESKELVLVFQIADEYTGNISSITLESNYSGNSYSKSF